MTLASLKSYSQKDLAQMAKQGGVRGWHTMRKDQLVKALLSASRSKASKGRTLKKTATPVARATSTSLHNGKSRVAKPHVAPTRHKPAPPRKPTSPRVLKHLAQVKAKLNQSKNLATAPRGKNGATAQGSRRSDGSRRLLVARHLGADSSERRSRPGGHGTRLAHGPADSSFGRGRRGWRNQRLRSACTRILRFTAELATGTCTSTVSPRATAWRSASQFGRTNSMHCAEAMSSIRPQPEAAMPLTTIGPTSRKTSTRFMP